jgi:hypothetical protein
MLSEAEEIKLAGEIRVRELKIQAMHMAVQLASAGQYDGGDIKTLAQEIYDFITKKETNENKQ